MWVGPCKACQDRSETKQWKWGACTTPSEQDAAYIVHACNNFPALLEAAQNYMAQIGQGYEAHGLPFGPAQQAAHERLTQAIASATGEA